MNGYNLNGQPLYVGRAQHCKERKWQLEREFQAKRQVRQSRFVGVNLYVKNLDENVTDDQLKATFADCGQITSVKVLKSQSDRLGEGY